MRTRVPAWATGTSCQKEQIFQLGPYTTHGDEPEISPSVHKCVLHTTESLVICPTRPHTFPHWSLPKSDTPGQWKRNSRRQDCGFPCAGVNEQVLSGAQRARGLVPRPQGRTAKAGPAQYLWVCTTRTGSGVRRLGPAGKGRAEPPGSLFWMQT